MQSINEHVQGPAAGMQSISEHGQPLQQASNQSILLTLPVIVLEAWPPVGSLQQGLNRAGQVHKPVTHQEEHAGERGKKYTD